MISRQTANHGKVVGAGVLAAALLACALLATGCGTGSSAASTSSSAPFSTNLGDCNTVQLKDAYYDVDQAKS